MSTYTTGELAKLCGISIRTIQFYDNKGLLHPSALSQGVRRLYSDDDMQQMQLICLLKSLGLSLESIKGVITSKNPINIMKLLLYEQEKHLKTELQDTQINWFY